MDARQSCLDVLASRFPSVQTIRCDLNFPDQLPRESFEVVHCYGILYHLERPADLIRYLGEICSDFTVLETCVQGHEVGVEIVDEVLGDYTQSSTGRGCRPGRKWVFEELKKHFPFVYVTTTQPNHVEFPTNWLDLSDAPPLIRSVFVASKRALGLPTLTTVLVDKQERYRSLAAKAN